MPLYEYECESCGHRFDMLAPSRSCKPDSPPCPECSRTETNSVLSVCAIGKSDGASGVACSVESGRG